MKNKTNTRFRLSSLLSPIQRFATLGAILYTSLMSFAAMALPATAVSQTQPYLVKDIYSNLADSSNPAGFVEINGIIYFSATTGSSGCELWKSNGTAAGTVMVKDINPGASSSSPSGLTNVNGVLYFVATDGTNGTELWTSNGTELGTIMVKDINPGASSSSPSSLANVNGALYFAANDGTNGNELWKSNGTEEGTEMEKKLINSTH